jgi:hypothetical protein
MYGRWEKMSLGRSGGGRPAEVQGTAGQAATFALKLGEILCYDHDYPTSLGDSALPQLG